MSKLGTWYLAFFIFSWKMVSFLILYENVVNGLKSNGINEELLFFCTWLILYFQFTIPIKSLHIRSFYIYLYMVFPRGSYPRCQFYVQSICGKASKLMYLHISITHVGSWGKTWKYKAEKGMVSTQKHFKLW